MTLVTLETDYWIETADPIANLLTDQWNFALTPHPSFSLKTDLWVPYFYDFSSNKWLQTLLFVGAETGEVQIMNVGKDDDGVTLYYELETQEIDFGNRAHLKNISDKVQVMSKFGIDSTLEGKEEDGDYKVIPMGLDRRINIGQDVDLKGKFFTFKWSGESNDTSPIFEGISIENVTDLGITDE